MKLSSYLLFKGNAKEALDFYQSVLGGEITVLRNFPEKMGNMPLSEEDRKKIMHATLDIKGQLLMFSDTMTAMESHYKEGTRHTICIEPDSKEEADRIFTALSEGGNVKMPINVAPWGDYFGMLTDKYEIHWMVNFHSGVAFSIKE